MSPRYVAVVLQVSGAVAGVAAAWMVDAAAGLGVLSVALILFGVAVERDS